MAKPGCAARYVCGEGEERVRRGARGTREGGGGEGAHLDAPDERRGRVEHDDVLWAQLVEDTVVLVAEVRADDDEVVVLDDAKVLGKVGLVERLVLDELLGLDARRRAGRVDPACRTRGSAAARREARGRTTHMSAILSASPSSASGLAPVAAANIDAVPP